MLNTLFQGAEIAAIVAAAFAFPVRRAYTWLRDDHRKIDALARMHNYPHRPPSGHIWPQLIEGGRRDHPAH